jgi:hypothetical protein
VEKYAPRVDAHKVVLRYGEEVGEVAGVMEE